MPQPTATPFTAAITGMSVCSRASASEVSRGSAARLSDTLLPAGFMICFTSSPEQNAGSAPVMTRQRAVVDRTARSASAYVVKLRALRASGRFSVRTPTWSASPYVISV